MINKYINLYERRAIKIPADLDNIKEYGLAIDDFLNPVQYKGRSAIEILLCRLILLEPGTFETHPDMGVGLISKYRYMNSEELHKLNRDIENQITVYMPWLYAVEVHTSIPEEGHLQIVIEANNQIFALTYDNSTTTLKREKLSLDSFT